MEDPRTYLLTSGIFIEHMKYSIVISLNYYRETDEVSVSVERFELPSDDCISLVERIYPNADNETIIYVPELDKSLGLPDDETETFSYTDFFDHKFIFKDYSAKVNPYEGDGYISINNGPKCPLMYYNRNEITRDIIDTNNLIQYRNKEWIEETYNGLEEYGIIYNAISNQIDNSMSIQMIRTGLSAISIIFTEEKVYELKDVNSEYVDIDESLYTIKKLEDDKYHITLAFDWIPDKVEIRNGFQQEFIIEKKYKRLQIVK
jgi:hypothetical protein